MKIMPLLTALTVTNLGMLSLTTLQYLTPAHARSDVEVLRGRGLEIVDDVGRVRASISVLPAGKSANGDPYAQTVLLRLITEKGRPTVKLGSSEPTSGLSLVGPTGTSDTYVILEARGTASSLKLRNEDGREQILRP
jgi:hypothetical protein